MREPTEQDLELADRANLYGASNLLGLSIRAAAQRQMEAYERAQRNVPRLYQPAPGLTIVDELGEAYWRTYHAAGCYIADPDLCRRAQRALIERDHAEALRRNDWFDRQRLTFELTELGRAEVA